MESGEQSAMIILTMSMQVLPVASLVSGNIHVYPLIYIYFSLSPNTLL